MANLNIPVGVSDFAEIRKNGYYFIDKSELIEKLVKTKATKVTLITRPRRFGKTLGMSMLANFFDIRKDSHELFNGLAISRDSGLCANWMNQYPTVFLTLKDVDGLDFESAKSMLQRRIAELCRQYFYLTESEKVNPFDKKIFLQLVDVVDGKTTDTMLKTSLSLIMQMLHDYYEKPVILLLDEYDVPLAKASAHGYYDQMLDMMRAMMSTSVKDNSNLLFAVVTGCLRISKESIFTGTNNFVSDSIVKSRLNEYFGFTSQEVEQILKDSGYQNEAERVRVWYDGYHFGEFDMYCPWDVLNYVYDLQEHEEISQPVSYWRNTSDNAVIRSFLDHKQNLITAKLEILLGGGYIIQKIDENLTYDFDRCSDENFWSVLYLTGYLTRCREKDLRPEDRNRIRDGFTALMIPNEEIQEIYRDTIVKWFMESAPSWKPENLGEAIWRGDVGTIISEMNRLLRKTISYHDYREDYYHAFLAGIFTGIGYAVESNRKHGTGRSDIVIADPSNMRVVIFEVKIAEDRTKLERECEEALTQIRNRSYAEEFLENGNEVLCYGIAFYKKECFVKRIE